MWRRDPRPDPMELHGLRRLTWRDGLLWRRAADMLATGALWCAVALWLLSGMYEIGSMTLAVVILLGGVVACAVGEWRADEDIPRWPRRTDPD